MLNFNRIKKKSFFLIFIFFLNIILALPETWNLSLTFSSKIIKPASSLSTLEEKIKIFKSYQFSSEALVYGRIVADELKFFNSKQLLIIEKNSVGNELKLEDKRLNPLFSSKEKNNLTLEKLQSEEWEIKNYTQQFGLQGNIFSFISNDMGIKNITILYLINICLMSSVIVFILNWIEGEFGKISMYLSSIVFLIFPRIIMIERNLYWIFWTYYLPFISSIYIMKYKKNNGLKYLILLSFTTVLLRSLMGYEFISTILINMEIPIMYYCLKRKESIKSLFFKCTIAGVGGLLGFFVAILLHLKRLEELIGNKKEAFELFLEPIRYRTHFLSNDNIGIKMGSEYLQQSLDAGKVEVLLKYLLDPTIIIILFLLIISFYFDICKRKNIEVIISIILSFIGVLSWLILASGHSYVHTFINTVLWVIPFGILSFAYFGKNIEEFLENRKEKR